MRGYSGSGWNVVATRPRPKFRGGRVGYSSGPQRLEVRPASKSQNESNGWTGSATGANSGASRSLSSSSVLSIDEFKDLNIDIKLDRSFGLCTRFVIDQ